MDNGLFTVHFSYVPGSKEINIKQTSFLDLNALLARYNYSMPASSLFLGVRIVDFYYDRHFDYEEVQLLVTTSNFHSFVLNISYDSHGVQIDARLTAVLLKYGYYNTNNYVKSIDGLVALGLVLPPEFQWIDYLPKQLLVLYDTRRHAEDRWDGPPRVLHFLGAIKSNSTFEFTYDFNFTVRRHNETFEIVDLGLMAVDPRGLYLRELRVSRNLSVVKTGKVNSGGLQFVARNDFSNYSDRLTLVSDDYLEWYEILLIVLFSLGTAAAAGYLALTVVRLRAGSPLRAEEVTVSMQASPLLAHNDDLAEEGA
jgi:hypothetical protein